MQNDQQYLKGTKNTIIRMYFYLAQGLNIINDFRNLFIGILALYVALKIDNLWFFPLVGIPSLMLLTVLGYFAVHQVFRVREWLSTKFGSHYAIQNFDYVKAQYELLLEIKELLKNGDHIQNKKR